MKDLIPVISSFNAMQALFKFWREWGWTGTPAERYPQVLANAAEQTTLEGFVRASVTMEDWHSGMRSFVMHQDNDKRVLDLIAPIIDGVRQPQVPLPFQGNLKAPRLVILTSNPQHDEALLKMPPDLRYKHQVMNLKNISGTWPIPGTFLPDQLTTPGAWAHDNWIAPDQSLITSDDVGNDHQFGIREVVRLSWFPYRSGKFLGSPFHFFSTGYPQRWLASQKLMLSWLAAYLRRVSRWPAAEQPLFVARQDTQWGRALHEAIERSDYEPEEKAAMLATFDQRLFFYASGGAALSRKGVVSAESVAASAKARREFYLRGRADFARKIDAVFDQD